MTLKAVAEDSVYLGFYHIPLYNWRITPYTLSCTLSLYGLYHCCNVLYDCLIADSMSSHYVLLMCSLLIKSAIVLESSTSTGRATIVAYPRLRNYSRAEVFHDKGLSSKAIFTLDDKRTNSPRGRGITVWQWISVTVWTALANTPTHTRPYCVPLQIWPQTLSHSFSTWALASFLPDPSKLFHCIWSSSDLAWYSRLTCIHGERERTRVTSLCGRASTDVSNQSQLAVTHCNIL